MCPSCNTTTPATTNGLPAPLALRALTPEELLSSANGDESSVLAQILTEMKKLSTSNAALQAKVSLRGFSFVYIGEGKWDENRGGRKEEDEIRLNLTFAFVFFGELCRSMSFPRDTRITPS